MSQAGDLAGTAVQEHVRDVLRVAPVAADYGAALRAALALPGNVLSSTPNLRWARTVWTCCTAAGGHWPEAVPAAAAVELFMVALDVLDDVEDAEETPLEAVLGTGRTLNVSTGLLFLAHYTLLGTVGAGAAMLLLDAGLHACNGQHTDLAPPPDQPLGLDEALAVAAAKAASLVAVACRLGSLCAGADTITQERNARFGAAVGMVSQLANDLAALHPEAMGKTDIALRRPTLPLVHAAQLAAARESRLNDSAIPSDLWSQGPIQLTWAVAETYRRHALDLIPLLTTDPAGRADLTAFVRMR